MQDYGPRQGIDARQEEGEWLNGSADVRPHKLNRVCSRTQEDANRGKPNWEHLSDELHVLITVEDTENRAQKKLERAVEEVQKLLIPVCFERLIGPLQPYL